jgi:hypothetical protein
MCRLSLYNMRCRMIILTKQLRPTTKARKTPKEIRGGPPAYRSLRAVGQPRPAACMRRPRLGSTARAPGSAARGPGRPGSFVVFRASARADSRMGARARVGLRPWGAGGEMAESMLRHEPHSNLPLSVLRSLPLIKIELTSTSLAC